jgi:RNA polymerase sigma-70 factor (ECF subfamily)
LYRRFAPRVRLYGLKHLGDEMAAQDLSQQVMLVAIQRLRAGTVRNPDEIGSFILGTSRMMAGTQRRTERRRVALHARFGNHAVSADAAEPLDLARLEHCLDAITERERTLLILTFYGDKPAAEIAEALATTAGAVRVLRHRALAKMRTCMRAGRDA